MDWRQVERRQVRERIDLAFHVMDKEYGVTRLLDPEGTDNCWRTAYYMKKVLLVHYIGRNECTVHLIYNDW